MQFKLDEDMTSQGGPGAKPMQTHIHTCRGKHMACVTHAMCFLVKPMHVSKKTHAGVCCLEGLHVWAACDTCMHVPNFTGFYPKSHYFGHVDVEHIGRSNSLCNWQGRLPFGIVTLHGDI